MRLPGTWRPTTLARTLWVARTWTPPHQRGQRRAVQWIGRARVCAAGTAHPPRPTHDTRPWLRRRDWSQGLGDRHLSLCWGRGRVLTGCNHPILLTLTVPPSRRAGTLSVSPLFSLDSMAQTPTGSAAGSIGQPANPSCTGRCPGARLVSHREGNHSGATARHHNGRRFCNLDARR